MTPMARLLRGVRPLLSVQVGALGLVLLCNWLLFPGFFHISVQDGRLFGSLIDVMNRGAPVAILAVGRTQQQFVPDANDQPVLRSFMTVTLSADHRVVDGAQAANFLQDLRHVLEEPALLAW